MEYVISNEHLEELDCKRVFIFGAGELGLKCLRQINEIKSGAICLGFIDNFVTTETAVREEIKKAGVHKPDVLTNSDYDFIVLACQKHFIPEICFSLFKLGVVFEKIVIGQYNLDEKSKDTSTVDLLSNRLNRKAIISSVQKNYIEIDIKLDISDKLHKRLLHYRSKAIPFLEV